MKLHQYEFFFILWFLPVRNLLSVSNTENRKNDETGGGNKNSKIQLAITKPKHKCVTTTCSIFSEVVKSSTFVDKTLLIKTFLENDEIMMVTCPRRFGKSTNLNMIKHFFEIQIDPKTSQPIDLISSPNFKMFEALKISQYKNIVNDHLGKYPVIYLDFITTEVEILSMENAIENARTVVKKAFSEHSYLLQSPKLLDSEKTVIDEWISIRCRTSFTTKASILDGVLSLAGFLKKHFGTPCVVLVDEYDAMGTSAMLYADVEIFNRVTAFVVGILNCMLKDNPNVHRGIVTGISYMFGVGSSNSKLNNINVYKFLQNDRYVEYYGLLEEEFQSLMEKHKVRSDNIGNAKMFYHGYSYKGITLYNTFSVVKFIEFLPNPPEPYWMDTESLLNFKDILFCTELEKDFLHLLNGKPITFEFMPTIDEYAISNLLNVLRDAKVGLSSVKDSYSSLMQTFYHSILYEQGYFVIDEVITKTRFEVSFANLEIKSKVLKKLKTAYDSLNRIDTVAADNILKVLKDIDFNNHEFDNKALEYIFTNLTKGFNIFYSRSRKEFLNEEMFRFFVLSMLESATKYYEIGPEVKDIDILLLAKDGHIKKVIIIELEHNTDVEEAFNQVMDRSYYKKYQEEGYEMIIIALTVIDPPRNQDTCSIEMMYQVNDLFSAKATKLVYYKERLHKIPTPVETAKQYTDTTFKEANHK